MTSYHDTPNPKVVTFMDASFPNPVIVVDIDTHSSFSRRSIAATGIFVVVIAIVTFFDFLSTGGTSSSSHGIRGGGGGQAGLTNTISTITTASASASDCPNMVSTLPSGNTALGNECSEICFPTPELAAEKVKVVAGHVNSFHLGKSCIELGYKYIFMKANLFESEGSGYTCGGCTGEITIYSTQKPAEMTNVD
mmetsp:Transcript_35368/g.39458  ORF Transcript_35368/g.39458 Transcript_35368/m.39458 type:complete len:194 (-) Transcript_35368:91-672(-)|eukprot:CAMPEP_0170797554 /NCGR_PEP_ID=MMETSP0733-20121128/25676_1 /TAXON_ID=186038 /ORGANISM="Fragilariopsis kerguelensis, Strain L26-C5" /LENGTH=193 /DNA_ID=CAMNT_0011148431 /DNA_START=79 /DNA_END=660 /DNA_ORIENTATION=-